MPGVLGLSDIAARPDAQAYKIVYAIVSQEKGEGLTLPFFSRLSLQNASKTLKGYGYRLGLAKIPVDATYAKWSKADACKAAKR